MVLHRSTRLAGPLVAGAVAVVVAGGGCGGGGPDRRQEGRTGPSARQPVIEAKSMVPRYAGSPGATKDPAKSGLAVLAALPDANKADTAAVAPNIRGSEGLSVAQFLDTVGNDVATFWQQQFNEAGYRFEPVTQTIVTGRGQSRCLAQGFDADHGPFYCTLDPGIFLPQGFFEKQANPIGDTADAIIVAHEWGHRVQDLLGLFEARRAGRLTGRQLELQADCLGGVWASTVYRRGLLEEGDLEEAIDITNRAGDAPGTPVNDPKAHGSSQERVSAFMRGFRGSGPGDCGAAQF